MMKKPKSGRVALITGANKGIGLETARQLAGRGWQVVIGARRSEAGEEAAASLTGKGAAVSFLKMDVADSDSITQASAEFGKRFKALDVLINNAGIYPDEGKNILNISRDKVEATLQTNTLGSLTVTQAFLPYLRAAVNARVINMSSGYG